VAKYRLSLAPPVSRPRGGASAGPQNTPAPTVGPPPQWWPRAGWGTVRGYQTRPSVNGGADQRFCFVPDDGSTPQLFEFTNMALMPGMGEYARGFVRDGNITIKVSGKIMWDAQSSFQKINALDLHGRKAMFANGNDIYGDAGWAWTPDYYLVTAAPGLR
jgi:hypothetical protein